MVKVITLIANRLNYGGKRKLCDIKYIVLHYTANKGDTARSNALYFKNNKPKTSAHYFVDDEGIYQSVLDNYAAYAVGGHKYNTAGGSLYGVCKNSNSISIELCDSIDKVPRATQRNAGLLIRSLMKMYGVPPERVVRHYDVTGKPCPRSLLDDIKWLEFKAAIMEGEIDMEELENLKRRVEKLEEELMVYDYIDENMPDWIKDITIWARDAGIIEGTGSGWGMTKAKAEALAAIRNALTK